MATRRDFLKTACLGGVALLGCGDDGHGTDGGLDGALDGGDGGGLDGGGDAGTPDGGETDGEAPDAGPPLPATGAPVLLNFRVRAGEPDRVYFDTSRAITGSTAVGFTVSGKTISSITVNAGAMTGHFFTVGESFDYFQQGRLIDYVGGSDLTSPMDLEGGGPHPFTVRHIRDDLAQPAATRERYVTVSGAGAHDGTAGNEWTFPEAVAHAAAGDLVHVAAGDYGGGTFTLSSSGSAARPIVFQGYRSTPGDIDALYWAYGDGAFDRDAMPYFDGGNRNDGIWLTATGRSGIVVRNFQVERYRSMVWASSGDDQRYEGLVCNHLGDPEDYSGVGLHTHGENVSYLDCTVVNATAVNIRTMSNSRYNLLRHCRSYCDESLEVGSKATTDYYFSNEGSFNVTKDCVIERFGDLQHHGHGYTFKDIGGEVHHNLLEDCVVTNVKQAIDLNLVAYDNVIRRVRVVADPSGSGALDGGIKLAANTRNNTFEYCTLGGFRDAAIDHEAADGDHSGNRLIGCVFTNLRTLVGQGSRADSLEFIHCVVDGVTSLGSALDASHSFTNTVFIGVNTGAAAASFSHCVFHDSFATPSGPGNVATDPRLDGDHRPTSGTPAAVAEGGTAVPGAHYDADGVERATPVTIGAYQVPAPA